MNKNLKLSYILYFVFYAIIIAWGTLSSFFHGTAINFVAILSIVLVSLILISSDSHLIKRTKDLFITSCVFCILELLVYLVLEFSILVGLYILVYQHILSFLGLIFFAYTTFRLILELKNIKIKFIEIMLGNEKLSKKAKKSKEVSNGSLEEKPNKKENSEQHFYKDIDDGEIIISEDEE